MSTRAQRFSWCFYDFANSAFPTVIVTAIYVLYFKGVVVGGDDPGYSDKLWGVANSVSALIVFLSAPLLGAAADLAGTKRYFLLGFAITSSVATGLLYFTGPGTIALAMILFIVANLGFESSCVFYNAFLPSLVAKDLMGRLSGKGWALGYLGGLGCLLLILYSNAIVGVSLIPEQIKMVPVVVAVWFGLFALPAFIALKDSPVAPKASGSPSYLVLGFRRLMDTFMEIRKHKALVRFLLSYFLYNNAVVTIIVFAVAFSSDSLSFSTEESIKLVIIMNVIAAPGAFVFGWVADRVGAKLTLVVALCMWIVVVIGCEIAVWPGMFSVEEAKNVFWGVSALASLCIGASQATSRSFVGQMAPDGQSAEFYGFMAFAGKGSAILGPMVFGLASDLFNSQRIAVGTVGMFFVFGLVLLLGVPSLKLQNDK